MTPKAKAIELYNKYMQMPFPTHTDRAKQCALIAVEEILSSGINIDYYHDKSIGYNISYLEYYSEVKQEIQNL